MPTLTPAQYQSLTPVQMQNYARMEGFSLAPGQVLPPEFFGINQGQLNQNTGTPGFMTNTVLRDSPLSVPLRGDPSNFGIQRGPRGFRYFDTTELAPDPRNTGLLGGQSDASLAAQEQDLIGSILAGRMTGTGQAGLGANFSARTSAFNNPNTGPLHVYGTPRTATTFNYATGSYGPSIVHDVNTPEGANYTNNLQLGLINAAGSPNNPRGVSDEGRTNFSPRGGGSGYIDEEGLLRRRSNFVTGPQSVQGGQTSIAQIVGGAPRSGPAFTPIYAPPVVPSAAPVTAATVANPIAPARRIGGLAGVRAMGGGRGLAV